jgi:phosphate-selective porin OprO/OprP
MKNRIVKSYRLAVVAVIAVAQLQAGKLFADDPPPSSEDVKALLKRIDELEAKVKTLERNRELDQDAAAEKAKTTPTISIGADGLVAKSADSNFTMYAHGYAQADARYYLGNKTVPDTFLLRRVRPIVEGSVFDKFDYRIMLDLGSGNGSGSTAGNVALLDDAYLNARLARDFQIQAGKFKSPVGLERLQSTAELLFVETGFATQMTPNYDLGVQIHNDVFNRPVGYAVGIFNGAADAASDDMETTDEGKDIEGRLFLQPFLNGDIEPLRHVGFGFGGSIGTHSGALPGYKTPGQQTFFSYTNTATADGPQYRLDPQLFYYYGPFGLEAEGILSSQRIKSTAAGVGPNARFNNYAWQVEASYFLTGEENSFKPTSLIRVNPRHPFHLGADPGWGAFELVGRVEQISLDELAFPDYATAASARGATSWGVGLNWYLNANVKLNLDYETTWFRGASKAVGAVSAHDERAILSRVQFEF